LRSRYENKKSRRTSLINYRGRFRGREGKDNCTFLSVHSTEVLQTANVTIGSGMAFALFPARNKRGNRVARKMEDKQLWSLPAPYQSGGKRRYIGFRSRAVERPISQVFGRLAPR